VHEHPFIGPNEEIPYEAGMLSTVETRVRWVGQKGLHMEDLFRDHRNRTRAAVGRVRQRYDSGCLMCLTSAAGFLAG
jgi:hypothetical protein